MKAGNSTDVFQLIPEIEKLRAEIARLRAALLRVGSCNAGRSLTWPEIDQIVREALSPDDGWLAERIAAAKAEGAREALRSHAGELLASSKITPNPHKSLWQGKIAEWLLSRADGAEAEAASREGRE